MPKPPNFDPVTDLAFITNYALLGCSNPRILVADLSGPALADLALLFVTPSFDDFIQGVLSPKGSRNARAGRHGRKSGRGFGIPDPNDLIANKLAGRIHPYTPIRMGLTRYAWGGLQLYEGINFAAALADGITNTKYDRLWGIFNISASHCREFARMARHWDDYGVGGGLGRPWDPMNINRLDFTVDFFDGNFGTGTSAPQWEIALKVHFWGIEGLPPATFDLQLRNQHDHVIASTGAVTIEPGQHMTLEINGEAKADDFISWGTAINSGNYAYLRADVLAYRDLDLFGW